jgi:hypothetical protein
MRDIGCATPKPMIFVGRHTMTTISSRDTQDNLASLEIPP